MKIFYDDSGKVVGYIQAATAEIESNISMPGASEIKATDEIKKRMEDPNDDLNHELIKVEDNRVCELSKNEVDELLSKKEEEAKILADVMKVQPSEEVKTKA